MSYDYYRQYGPLYEFIGFSCLDEAQKAELSRILIQKCLDHGFAVGGSIPCGHIEVIGDRNSGYPDVYLEVTSEGRLIACDLGPASRKAWALVKRLIRSYRKLPIEEIQS